MKLVSKYGPAEMQFLPRVFYDISRDFQLYRFLDFILSKGDLPLLVKLDVFKCLGEFFKQISFLYCRHVSTRQFFCRKVTHFAL